MIIAARDAATTLGATLAALAEQDIDQAFEVVVVDDGSQDATVAVADAAALEVTVVSEAGVGPGPARNAGVRVAGGELLAFTDADCVPTAGWLRAGVAALAGVELVQGAVHADPAAPAAPFGRTVWVTREAGLYECASLFVRRAAFDRVGGFEDWLGARIGKPLAEDAWLGWRLRRSGVQSTFCSDALVHHAVFERRAGAFVAERLRLVYFPLIARQMPELRRTVFFGRLFLSRRSAACDAAVTAGAIAIARRRPIWLLAAFPWLWMLGRAALPWGRRAPAVAGAEAAADGVGLLSLALGSLRARTPVF